MNNLQKTKFFPFLGI